MLLHAGDDGCLMAYGQISNLAAWPLPIAPKPQELIYLLDRKAERSCALDEAQLMDVAFVEDPVAGFSLSGGAQQASALVVPNEPGRNVGVLGCFADPHFEDISQIWLDLPTVGRRKRLIMTER